MKKILTSLAVFLIAMCSMAQTSEHLMFKGVPIDGTLSEYVLKMQQNGFTYNSTEDNVAILTGDFAAYKNCTVVVSTLEQQDLVNQITVFFTDCNTWSTLSNNYFDLKEMLSEKYGAPTAVLEKFDTFTKPGDDDDRMHHVKFDRCKYSTTYRTEKGIIELSISHNGVISCFVTLSYYDRINSGIIRSKAIDDL